MLVAVYLPLFFYFLGVARLEVMVALSLIFVEFYLGL